MRRRLTFYAFLFLVCLPAGFPALNPAQQPPPTQPQTPPAQTQAAPTQPAPAAPVVIGPAKIAWFNLEQVILACEEGKKEFVAIQQFVDKKNGELEAMRKELDALKNQLNVQGPKLTDEARADLEDQIESKETTLQRFSQDTQKDIENRRNRAINFISRKVMPLIDKIAKEKGLSAVLLINPQRDAWIDASLIITEEVVKAYNAAHPGGPAAGAPTARKP